MKGEIPIGDIPQEVLDAVGEGLQHFLLPIYTTLGPSAPRGANAFLGSGTLVRVDHRYCILTAAHVWRAVKKSSQAFFVLRGAPSAFTVPHGSLQLIHELYETEAEQWGPDLALLEIPLVLASSIEANRSFLNLPMQRELFFKQRPNFEKKLLAVTGMLDELTEVRFDPTLKGELSDVAGRAFISAVERVHTRGAYDYVDFKVNSELSGVPKSFGGTSGGGLWQIELRKKEDGELHWDGSRRFCGVAFWEQHPGEGRHQMVRCHGPRSIFETAWAKWGL